MKTRSIDFDRLRETFRDEVLASLDRAALAAFGRRWAPHVPAPGASDGDLPALFRVIDAHAETLAERYGFTVTGAGGD